MADITKRVNKRAAAHLGSERAEVVLLCEMKGTYGVGMVPAVAATLPTLLTMKRKTAKRLDDQGGVAASFPRGIAAAVAITPTHLVAMPSTGMTFKPPTLAIDRRHVCAELIGRRGFGKRLIFRFSDGSEAEVDIGPGQPVDRFVELLNATSSAIESHGTPWRG